MARRRFRAQTPARIRMRVLVTRLPQRRPLPPGLRAARGEARLVTKLPAVLAPARRPALLASLEALMRAPLQRLLPARARSSARTPSMAHRRRARQRAQTRRPAAVDQGAGQRRAVGLFLARHRLWAKVLRSASTRPRAASTTMAGAAARRPAQQARQKLRPAQRPRQPSAHRQRARPAPLGRSRAAPPSIRCAASGRAVVEAAPPPQARPRPPCVPTRRTPRRTGRSAPNRPRCAADRAPP